MIEDYIKKIEKENMELNRELVFLKDTVSCLKQEVSLRKHEASCMLGEIKRLRSLVPPEPDPRSVYERQLYENYWKS